MEDTILTEVPLPPEKPRKKLYPEHFLAIIAGVLLVFAAVLLVELAPQKKKL